METLFFVLWFGGIGLVILFASLNEIRQGREQISQALLHVDASQIEVVHSFLSSGRDHTSFEVSYRDAQGRHQRTTCKVIGYGGQRRLFWLQSPQFERGSVQSPSIYPRLPESAVLVQQKALIRRLRVENERLRRHQTPIQEKTLSGYGQFLN